MIKYKQFLTRGYMFNFLKKKTKKISTKLEIIYPLIALVLGESKYYDLIAKLNKPHSHFSVSTGGVDLYDGHLTYKLRDNLYIVFASYFEEDEIVGCFLQNKYGNDVEIPCDIEKIVIKWLKNEK